MLVNEPLLDEVLLPRYISPYVWDWIAITIALLLFVSYWSLPAVIMQVLSSAAFCLGFIYALVYIYVETSDIYIVNFTSDINVRTAEIRWTHSVMNKMTRDGRLMFELSVHLPSSGVKTNILVEIYRWGLTKRNITLQEICTFYRDV